MEKNSALLAVGTNSKEPWFKIIRWLERFHFNINYRKVGGGILSNVRGGGGFLNGAKLLRAVGNGKSTFVIRSKKGLTPKTTPTPPQKKKQGERFPKVSQKWLDNQPQGGGLEQCGVLSNLFNFLIGGFRRWFQAGLTLAWSWGGSFPDNRGSKPSGGWRGFTSKSTPKQERRFFLPCESRFRVSCMVLVFCQWAANGVGTPKSATRLNTKTKQAVVEKGPNKLGHPSEPSSPKRKVSAKDMHSGRGFHPQFNPKAVRSLRRGDLAP